MSRAMLDCTGVNAVSAYEKLPDVAIVGCYVTGTEDVIWTEAEKELWAKAGKILVTIDQGYQSAEITAAIVRDVEPEAWAAEKAVDLDTWMRDVSRPTIYCDQTDLKTVLAAGWKGDLWLAIPGWADGNTLPEHGSCTVVAVQNAENTDNLYDTSIVLDEWWPAKESVTTMTVDQSKWAWCKKCQGLFYGPAQAESACPRGGTHDDQGSFVYTLTAEETSP